MRTSKYIFLTILLAIIASCNKPEDAMVRKNLQDVDGEYSGGMYIVNEGNFDWGHGTIFHYDTDKVNGKASEEVFYQNNNFELGNVVQSICIDGDKAYVVVNNSEKIEVVERNTMKWIGRIDIPKSSPRYILPLTDSKAYVTELYADGFWVVDLKKEAVIKKVSASGWTENMLRYGNYVYMTKTRTVMDTRPDGQVLMKIDAVSDQIIDSLSLPFGPIDVQIDKFNKLWVLCNGGLIDKNPALVRIDAETFKKEKQFSFDNLSSTMPANLRINNAKDELYFLNGGVYKMSVLSENLPEKPFIDKGKYLWYGIDISPEGDLWLSDAVDYVQRGWAFRFNNDGEKIDSVRVGVIPNGFVFN